MSLLKILLLFGLVGTIFARHIVEGHYEDHDHNDDHHYEDDEDDIDESYLIPARSNYGTRRTVLWTGPNSYNGYRDYQKKQTQQRPTQARQSNYYPRQSTSVSRGTLYPQRRPYSRPVTIPLRNKQRAGDERYKQGLRELADLTF
nr:hypothetical transcript [Hymenolepis microstoma]